MENAIICFLAGFMNIPIAAAMFVQCMNEETETIFPKKAFFFVGCFNVFAVGVCFAVGMIILLEN